MRVDLVWDGCHRAIDDSVISSVENMLAIQFPLDFVKVIRLCHGGYPTPRRFSYTDPDLGPIETSLAELLSFDMNYRDNIVNTQRYLAQVLRKGLIAIADDGGGDYVCMDFGPNRRRRRPKIVYWPHERGSESSIIVLSDTFTGFLDMLHS